MKKTLLYLFIFQFSIVTAQKADVTLLKANALVLQQKYGEALSVIQSGKIKNSVELLKLTANCYFRGNNYNTALTYYLKTDSLYPASASLEISKCYALINKPDLSIEWLRKYLSGTHKLSEYDITTDKAFTSITNNKAWSELWKKEWYTESEIEKSAAKALILKGKNIEALDQLDVAKGKIYPKSELFALEATIYMNVKQWDIALYNINLALETNNRNDNYYFIKSQIEFNSGKYSDCVLSLTKALEINPNLPDYYLQRGKAGLLSGNTELANNDLNLYYQLFPESEEGIYQMGKLESSKGNNLNALDYYAKLIQKNQSNPLYFTEYGDIAFKTQKYELAEENTMLALDINPNLDKANLLKGQIRLYFGDNESACGYLKKAVEKGNAVAIKLYAENCSK